MPGILGLVRLIFDGAEAISMKILDSNGLYANYYRRFHIFEDEFNCLITALKGSILKSKCFKLPQLKIVIFNFSELRDMVVCPPCLSHSRRGSVFSSMNSGFSAHSVYHRPRMFRKLKEVNGLNNAFEKFFRAAAKDERLSQLYDLSATDTEKVKTLKNKYNFMLSCLMGHMHEWRGSTLTEIHTGKAKCPFAKPS